MECLRGLMTWHASSIPSSVYINCQVVCMAVAFNVSSAWANKTVDLRRCKNSVVGVQSKSTGSLRGRAPHKLAAGGGRAAALPQEDSIVS